MTLEARLVAAFSKLTPSGQRSAVGVLERWLELQEDGIVVPGPS